MISRGDVVIVEFPYQDGTKGKNRPALVVQYE
jgi:mRNA-degrading endonuclease toxin of MazEF toxin-antitoxin module